VTVLHLRPGDQFRVECSELKGFLFKLQPGGAIVDLYIPTIDPEKPDAEPELKKSHCLISLNTEVVRVQS
jgi:hypothetical protein